jgi:hypothetical protein
MTVRIIHSSPIWEIDDRTGVAWRRGGTGTIVDINDGRLVVGPYAIPVPVVIELLRLEGYAVSPPVDVDLVETPTEGDAP